MVFENGTDSIVSSEKGDEVSLEIKQEWLKKQLNNLKIEIDNGLNKSEVLLILEKYKDSTFSKSKLLSVVVVGVQAGLKQLGFFDGKKIDGMYGYIDTRPAILDFQEQRNKNNPDDIIEEDGKYGPQTISRMISELTGTEKEQKSEPVKTDKQGEDETLTTSTKQDQELIYDIKQDLIIQELKNLDIEIDNGLNKSEILLILKRYKYSTFSKSKKGSVVIVGVQAGLKELGFFDGKKIDGIYGDRDTKPAILDFQEQRNKNNPDDIIDEDGKYGPQTISKIIIKLSGFEQSLEAEIRYKRKVPEIIVPRPELKVVRPSYKESRPTYRQDINK